MPFFPMRPVHEEELIQIKPLLHVQELSLVSICQSRELARPYLKDNFRGVFNPTPNMATW